jgi:hypothetical protein
MKFIVSTTTTNRQFVKALRRQHPNVEILKSQIEKISSNNCAYEIFLLAFVDRDLSYSKVIAGEVGIFEFKVGYDFRAVFPPDDDVLVSQLLEVKELQMIATSNLPRATIEEFRSIIVNWTSQVITM